MGASGRKRRYILVTGSAGAFRYKEISHLMPTLQAGMHTYICVHIKVCKLHVSDILHQNLCVRPRLPPVKPLRSHSKHYDCRFHDYTKKKSFKNIFDQERRRIDPVHNKSNSVSTASNKAKNSRKTQKIGSSREREKHKTPKK